MKEKKAKRSSGGISWIFGYLGFGVGAIGMDLSYGLFNSFLTKYLTDVLLLNAAFLLIVPTLARIWDGINDPMMGSIVDKTRTSIMAELKKDSVDPIKISASGEPSPDEKKEETIEEIYAASMKRIENLKKKGE